MPNLTLTYFDNASSRGEECRLALFVAGMPFTDERLQQPQWAERRVSTPYGALPVLTVEGHRPIAQSNAILRLVGSMKGLLPADPWESARHEAVLGAVEDMRARLAPTRRIADPEEKKRAREELARGFLPEWARQLEQQIGDPFVGGASLGVADIKIFVALTPLLNGSIDHIPADTFRSFPKVLRLFEAVKNHPKILEWYSRH